MGNTGCETGYCMGVGGKTTGWPVGRGRVRWGFRGRNDSPRERFKCASPDCHCIMVQQLVNGRGSKKKHPLQSYSGFAPSFFFFRNTIFVLPMALIGVTTSGARSEAFFFLNPNYQWRLDGWFGGAQHNISWIGWYHYGYEVLTKHKSRHTV